MPSASSSTTPACAARASRWCVATGQVLANGLAVLGIGAPDQM